MTTQAVVYVVDDDAAVRESLEFLFGSVGLATQTFATAEGFLAAVEADACGCLVLDMRMPGMSGLALQAELARRGVSLPVIFLTAHGTIPLTVKAMRAGAADFLTKPVDGRCLLECVRAVLGKDADPVPPEAEDQAADGRFVALTEREREVLALALAGLPNKEIARRLTISIRTVEHHRSHILLKTGASNLLELAFLLSSRQ